MKALSKKEMRVILGLCQGLINKQIADEMNTSEQCVKNLLRWSYAKMGVSTRTEAVLFAIRRRWFDPYQ